MNAIDHKKFETVSENSADELIVENVCDIDDAIAMKDEWIALEEECSNSVLFQSYAWCANFLKFSVETDPVSPVITTIRKDRKLVALLPMAIQRNTGTSLLTGLTEPFQQYTDVLLSKDVEAEDIKEHFFKALKFTGVDYVHFGQVKLNSDLAKLLDAKAKQTGEKDAAPFVSLGDWPDFKSYFKSVKQKTRKNMRNARNRLNKTAKIHHASALSGPVLEEVINRSYEGREAWLERLGITSRAFRHSDFKGFLDRFKSSEKTGIKTIAMTLSHGDNPMSDQFGFIYRGRYYAFMATWHEDYEPYSPGKLHLGEVIETCYDQDLEVVDFMIPAVSYKFTWAEQAVPVSDYTYAMSFRGFLRCDVWLGTVRPLAKKLYSSMPTEVRSFLMKNILGCSKRT